MSATADLRRPKETLYFNADGDRIYPCRCGEVHVGDYAEYDYGHHNCFHDIALYDAGHGQLLCPECGKSFSVAS
jgi:hypothetical protein